jgi:hypothetical protein
VASAVGLGRKVALYYPHPLYTRFTQRFGTSSSDTTTRPKPSLKASHVFELNPLGPALRRRPRAKPPGPPSVPRSAAAPPPPPRRPARSSSPRPAGAVVTWSSHSSDDVIISQRACSSQTARSRGWSSGICLPPGPIIPPR